MVVQAVEAYARGQGHGDGDRRRSSPRCGAAGASRRGGRSRRRPGRPPVAGERVSPRWPPGRRDTARPPGPTSAYGVVYWLGRSRPGHRGARPPGHGARRARRGSSSGALFVVVFPWLLLRERGWFDRWVLSRRDFARVLTLLVALRAIEVARIAWMPRAETVSVLGVDVSMRVGGLGLLPPHGRHGRDARARGLEPRAVSASDAGRAASPGGRALPGRRAARRPEPAPGEVRWTPEAEARVARAPMFLRGMVRRLAEKRARAEGVRVITPELMTRYKTEMMGLAASGGYQVPAVGRPVDAGGRGPPRRRAAVHAADDAPDLRGAGGRARRGGGHAGADPGGGGGGRDRGGGDAAPVDAGGRGPAGRAGSGRRRP